MLFNVTVNATLNNPLKKRRGKNLYRLSFVKRKVVYEHRVIAEKMIGRKLLPNEIVHHKNGDGYDNREENLEVTTRKKHQQEHLRPKYDIEKAIELYREGVKWSDIARKLHCDPSNVRRGVLCRIS